MNENMTELKQKLSDIPDMRFTLFIENKIDYAALARFFGECAASRSIGGVDFPDGIIWDEYEILPCSGDVKVSITVTWKNGYSNCQNGSVLAYHLSNHFTTGVVWMYTYYIFMGNKRIIQCLIDTDCTVRLNYLHASPVRGRGEDEFDISHMMRKVRFGWWQGWPVGDFAKSLYREMKSLKKKEREKATKAYLARFMQRAVKTEGVIISSVERSDEDPGREYSYCYRDAQERDYVWILADSIHYPSNQQWSEYLKARTIGALVEIWYDEQYPGVHYHRLTDD